MSESAAYLDELADQLLTQHDKHPETGVVYVTLAMAPHISIRLKAFAERLRKVDMSSKMLDNITEETGEVEAFPDCVLDDVFEQTIGYLGTDWRDCVPEPIRSKWCLLSTEVRQAIYLMAVNHARNKDGDS